MSIKSLLQATSYFGKINLLKLHSKTLDGTIEQLEQLEPPYSVITHLGTIDDSVQEFRAVVSNCSELVHTEDYVKLHPSFCEVNCLVESNVFCHDEPSSHSSSHMGSYWQR